MKTRNTIIRRIRRGTGLIDIHTHVGLDPVNYIRGDFPYAQSAEDLLLRMERWGVDAAACFPFLYTAWFDLRMFLKGRIRKSSSTSMPAPYVMENRRLCEEIYEAYPQAAGRLLPFCFFDPARRQQEQVAALRKLIREYPLFGLKTATSYIQSHITDLLKGGKCLLDFAAENNLPVTLHTSVAPGDPWADVDACIKVVRARPDVRFSLAHTCRFKRSALEAAASLDNCFVDFSAFKIHCDLVVADNQGVAEKKQRFRANYRNHVRAMQTIVNAFPDTMLWGTDSPYYNFMGRFTDDTGKTIVIRLQCGTDAEIRILEKLPEQLIRRIARKNTLRYLFGS